MPAHDLHRARDVGRGGSQKCSGPRRRILERHHGGVAPEGFQIVEVAFFGLEDVDEDAVVIEDDPLAGREAVLVGGEPEVIAEFFADLGADGFEVWFARAGADDKVVGEA